ncbi:MAG TPA: isoprenylcysteine carboxylmethyltransferase family protein [Acidobacteriota bacterium]|nr:isoprenylcysteine carboxylmethyltransferase family protein [Acidobacteriota bacterium]HQF86189.1 isoprenylcysteine carboxylmethyltransferase family protein [Acidobacteriota bacterium]HQG90567.1 isoprenylcysteine carboxylmethyltransferase family protein [Acidobacteriota bacterium]HQK86213.1 isoprenylcysteine carboxylmethyltransferase family protein [Acidobacteriota bacterium]
MLRIILWSVVALFPVSEIALSIIKRADAACARREDRGSLRLLWLMITLGVILAVAFKWMPAARFRLPGEWDQFVALGLLVSGLVIRWSAIMALGRQFTVDVAIHTNHELVQRGLYRWVRHPSYTGLLIAFLGLGIAFANWLSLAVLMAPITWAVIRRIECEERALHKALGPAYAAYCARVKRLVPGLI